MASTNFENKMTAEKYKNNPWLQHLFGKTSDSAVCQELINERKTSFKLSQKYYDIFGYRPLDGEFILVTCSKCSKKILAQGFKAHIETCQVPHSPKHEVVKNSKIPQNQQNGIMKDMCKLIENTGQGPGVLNGKMVVNGHKNKHLNNAITRNGGLHVPYKVVNSNNGPIQPYDTSPVVILDGNTKLQTSIKSVDSFEKMAYCTINSAYRNQSVYQYSVHSLLPPVFDSASFSPDYRTDLTKTFVSSACNFTNHGTSAIPENSQQSEGEMKHFNNSYPSFYEVIQRKKYNKTLGVVQSKLVYPHEVSVMRGQFHEDSDVSDEFHEYSDMSDEFHEDSDINFSETDLSPASSLSEASATPDRTSVETDAETSNSPSVESIEEKVVSKSRKRLASPSSNSPEYKRICQDGSDLDEGVIETPVSPEVNRLEENPGSKKRLPSPRCDLRESKQICQVERETFVSLEIDSLDEKSNWNDYRQHSVKISPVSPESDIIETDSAHSFFDIMDQGEEDLISDLISKWSGPTHDSTLSDSSVLINKLNGKSSEITQAETSVSNTLVLEGHETCSLSGTSESFIKESIKASICEIDNLGRQQTDTRTTNETSPCDMFFWKDYRMCRVSETSPVSPESEIIESETDSAPSSFDGMDRCEEDLICGLTSKLSALIISQCPSNDRTLSNSSVSINKPDCKSSEITQYETSVSNTLDLEGYETGSSESVIKETSAEDGNLGCPVTDTITTSETSASELFVWKDFRVRETSPVSLESENDSDHSSFDGMDQSKECLDDLICDLASKWCGSFISKSTIVSPTNDTTLGDSSVLINKLDGESSDITRAETSVSNTLGSEGYETGEQSRTSGSSEIVINESINPAPICEVNVVVECPEGVPICDQASESRGLDVSQSKVSPPHDDTRGEASAKFGNLDSQATDATTMKETSAPDTLVSKNSKTNAIMESPVLASGRKNMSRGSVPSKSLRQSFKRVKSKKKSNSHSSKKVHVKSKKKSHSSEKVQKKEVHRIRPNRFSADSTVSEILRLGPILPLPPSSPSEEIVSPISPDASGDDMDPIGTMEEIIPESSTPPSPTPPDDFTDLENRVRIYRKIQQAVTEEEKIALIKSIGIDALESSMEPTPADSTNLYNRLKAAFLSDPHPSKEILELLKSMGADMQVASSERPKNEELPENFSLNKSNSPEKKNISSKETSFATKMMEKYNQQPIQIMVPPRCERKTYLGFKMFEEFRNLNIPFRELEKEKSNVLSVFWRDRASELMPREAARIPQPAMEQEIVSLASNQSCTFMKIQQHFESEESHASCPDSTTVESLPKHNYAKETESVAHTSRQDCTFNKVQQLSKRKYEEEYDLEPVPHASHQRGTYKKVRRLSTHNYAKETESVAHTSHQTSKLSKRKRKCAEAEEYDLEPVAHASHQRGTFKKVRRLSKHNYAKETESVAHTSHQSSKLSKSKCAEETELEPEAQASQQSGTFSTHNYAKEAESVVHTSHQSSKLSKSKCAEETELGPEAQASQQSGTFSTHNYAKEAESVVHTSHQSSKVSKSKCAEETELEPEAQASHQSDIFKKVHQLSTHNYAKETESIAEQLPEPESPETQLTNSHHSATPLNQKDQPERKEEMVPEHEITNYAFYNEPYHQLLLKASREFKDACASGPCSFQTKREIGFASCLVSEEMWDTSLSTNLQQQRWGTKSLVSKDVPSPSSGIRRLRKAMIKEKKRNASGTTAKTSHLVPLLLKNWSYGTQPCLFDFNKYESSSTSKEKGGKQESSGEGKKGSKEDNSDEGGTKKKKSGDTNR